MNKGVLIIGIIMMALLGIFAVNLVTTQQTGQELDYYLLKDTTDAAMNDAIDVAFYASNGVPRMDKEKFVESFIKRFADSVDSTRAYNIKFYDMNETPPKVSVKVTSKNNSVNRDKQADIVTSADMIIESNFTVDEWVKNYYSKYNNTSSKNIENY